LPAFEATYGFRLKDAQLLTLSGGNTSATLRAAAEGTSGVNAAMAYFVATKISGSEGRAK